MAKLNSRIKIDVSGITVAEKNRLIYIINAIAKKHRQYFGFPVDQKLPSIEIYGQENKSPELIKYKALGLAFFSGKIQQVYMNDPRWDAQIWSMEHGHHVIMEALPFKGYNDEANNLIHYAANVGHPYIIKENVKYYPSLMDRLRRRFQVLPLQWYNMNRILDDMVKINKEIGTNTAPDGPHKYWITADMAMVKEMAADGIAHAFTEADLHGGGGHHHHHHHHHSH